MPYKDKATQKAAVARLHREHKDRLQKFVDNYKSGRPCQDCGVEYPPYVMEFDHRDPTEKVDNVSRLVNNRKTEEAILAEINKCDLVCANCHRERTHS